MWIDFSVHGLVMWVVIVTACTYSYLFCFVKKEKKEKKEEKEEEEEEKKSLYNLLEVDW